MTRNCASDKLTTFHLARQRVIARGLKTDQDFQAAGLLLFLGRMLCRAEWIELRVENKWPSALAGNHSKGRWVEMHAIPQGYRMEKWDDEALASGDPLPESRIKYFTYEDAWGWSFAIVYASGWIGEPLD